jgi:hypothetical protein
MLQVNIGLKFLSLFQSICYDYDNWQYCINQEGALCIMLNLNWEEEAKWIWTSDWSLEDDNKVGGFVYFRKKFYLNNEHYKSILMVSADSRYKFFINGIPVSFGPCKGDRFTWYYETIDIGKYLKKGINVLAAQVLRYPYSHIGKGNRAVWRSPLGGFYVHGTVSDLNGNVVEELHTNESWKCMKDASISLLQGDFTASLGIMESVDGKKVPFGWKLPEYCDEDWSVAVAYNTGSDYGILSPWQLTERPIPMMKEDERSFASIQRVPDSIVSKSSWEKLLNKNSPVIIPPHGKAIVELDAGELTSGFINLSMAQGTGAAVRLLCSECYEREPLPGSWNRNKGIRTDSDNGLLYGDYDTYKVAGSGSDEELTLETYEPFWFRTFRYIRLEIETAEAPLILHEFSYREIGYPLEVAGEFVSSSEVFSKFWEVSLRTLKRCMHESYEDCPYYEQLQYAMDTRSQILFTYNISGDDRLARKTIYDFHSSMLPDGLTQSRYPSFEPQVIPGFSLYWIHMLYDHMMYYGDEKFIRRYLGSVDTVLDFFHRMLDERGLVGAMSKRYWSFVDWTDEWRELRGIPTASEFGPITVYSLMYAAALQRAADIANFVGRTGIASEYLQRADEVSSAVTIHCKSAKQPALFTDGPGVEKFSQHTQIWAVLSNTVKGEEAKRLMDIVLTDGSLSQCSFAMSFYLFRALSETGLYNRSFSLWKPWKNMLDQGLTTWMEDTVSKRSDCHAWGALPLYEFGAEILGVQPMSSGYNKIKVHPKLGELKWAKGKVTTINGIVEVEWKVNDGRFSIEVNGPEKIPLILLLPDGSNKYFDSAHNVKEACNLQH